jgi:hypothetical protein
VTQEGHWSAERARVRRETFLEVFERTGSEALACEAAPCQPKTPDQWAKRHPDFKVRYELLKSGVVKESVKGRAEDFPAEDFLRFRELCFAYKGLRDGKWHRAVNSFYQRDAYKALQEHNRLIVILPPGHIKTTFFCQEYPTWNIMRDRDFRCLVIQKNTDEATKLVGAVQRRLEDHDWYDHTARRLIEQKDDPIINPLSTWFPKKPFRNTKREAGDAWGKTGFRVIGQLSGEKDLTMQAKGPGGQIQGVRSDLILLDDVQDPMASLDDSKKLLDWFHGVILGRVTDQQKVVVLANYFQPDDFAHLLVQEHPDWAVVEYPAIIDSTVDPDLDEGEVRPLCPEFWTLDALELKRKEVGERTWHYTWMQEAGSFEQATFKREALEAAMDDEFTIGEVPHAVTDVFLGVDPATAASGYCAIVAWGLDRRTKQRYLIDVFNKQGMRNWQNVIAQIVEMCRDYSPRTVVIERANTQGSLINDESLRREMRSMGVKIVDYKTATGTGARAEQANFDITTIGGLFDGGLITLPGGGTFEDLKRVQDYIDQLVKWRTDDDGNSIKRLTRDMVMATLFAESEAFELARREIGGKSKSRPVPAWVRSETGDWAWRKRRRGKQAELATSP